MKIWTGYYHKYLFYTDHTSQKQYASPQHSTNEIGK